ncbi:hypothetical protein I3F58_21180 [Streptomyces sp. MUM 203J]|uniref:hypothetical protein n=1 Tax=Streptomyces sp. MUM 203J TaxID=2791990 RepID=UPI001F04EC77|nr:hypothetical protein [Streptomyces sp. MUM 203J]MCH0542026.1 hypothetical protein [Streptomyces sp. MUM 203J]
MVTDRQIELLLKKKASVLHLSAANYWWFEDPAKALCLKLASTTQATHHISHRSVWQPEGPDHMALSHQQRDQTERRVRAAIDRLPAGQLPPGGACDVKTLASEAGISRASRFRTWGHLKDEFEKRRAAAWADGQQPDPREARISRLRDLDQRSTGRLARPHIEFNQLKEHHHLLLSVLTAKDDELQRLRRELSTFPAPDPDEVQGDGAHGVASLPRL